MDPLSTQLQRLLLIILSIERVLPLIVRQVHFTLWPIA